MGTQQSNTQVSATNTANPPKYKVNLQISIENAPTNKQETNQPTTFLYTKLSDDATEPAQQFDSSIGHDIFSACQRVIPPWSRRVCLTDLAIQCPEGCYIRLAPKSRLAVMHSIDIGAGVVDGGYRGNIGVLVINNSNKPYRVQKGDPIAQIIFERAYSLQPKEVMELSSTERQESGMLDAVVDESCEAYPIVFSVNTVKREPCLHPFAVYCITILSFLLLSSSLTLVGATFDPLVVSQQVPSDPNFAHTRFYNLCGQSRSGYAIDVPKKVRCVPPNIT